MDLYIKVLIIMEIVFTKNIHITMIENTEMKLILIYEMLLLVIQ